MMTVGEVDQALENRARADQDLVNRGRVDHQVLQEIGVDGVRIFSFFDYIPFI